MIESSIYPAMSFEQFSYLMLAATGLMWGVFGTFSVRWCCYLVNGLYTFRRPRGDKPFPRTTEQTTRAKMVSHPPGPPVLPLSPKEIDLCREWNEYEQSLIFLPSFSRSFGVVLLNALVFALASGVVWWYLHEVSSTGAPLIWPQVAALVVGWLLLGPGAVVATNRAALETTWLKALGVTVAYLAATVFLTMIVLIGVQVATDFWR